MQSNRKAAEDAHHHESTKADKVTQRTTAPKEQRLTS